MKLTAITEALSKSLLEKTAQSLNVSGAFLKSAIAGADIDANRLPHGDWICKQFAKEFQGRSVEDEMERGRLFAKFGTKLNELIQNFVKLKAQIQRAGRSININDYNINLLKSTLHDATVSAGVSLEGVQKIGQVNDMTVYKVTDPDSLAEMGEGTSWCTRASYPMGSRANQYLDMHGALFVVTKKRTESSAEKPFMQICSDLSEPKDAKNADANIPIEILKIILPHIELTARQLYSKLYELSVNDQNKELIIALIKKAFDSGIVQNLSKSGIDSLYTYKDVGYQLGRLHKSMTPQEQNLVNQLCVLSPPIIGVEYAKQLEPSEAKRLYTAMDETQRNILTDRIKENKENIVKLFEWIYNYIANFSPAGWTELDDAMTMMLREATEETTLKTKRTFGTIISLAESSVVKYKYPFPKFTKSCIELVENMKNPENFDYIIHYMKTLKQELNIDYTEKLDALFLANPFALSLMRHFDTLDGRWPAWEKRIFEPTPFEESNPESYMNAVGMLCSYYVEHVLRGHWPAFEKWLLEHPLAPGYADSNVSFELAAAQYAHIVQKLPWPEMMDRYISLLCRTTLDDNTTSSVANGVLSLAYVKHSQHESEQNIVKLLTPDVISDMLEHNPKIIKLLDFGYISESFDSRSIFVVPELQQSTLSGFDRAVDIVNNEYQNMEPNDYSVEEHLEHINAISDAYAKFIAQLAYNRMSIPNLKQIYKDFLKKAFDQFDESYAEDVFQNTSSFSGSVWST